MASQLGNDGARPLSAIDKRGGAPYTGQYTQHSVLEINVKRTDNLILCDGDDADVDVNLPSAAGSRFQIVTIKWNKAADDSGSVEIDPGTDFIEHPDGTIDSNVVALQAQEWLTYCCDGTNWWLIGGRAAGMVTNESMSDMAQSTIKGRAVGAGTGDPTDLTPAQAGKVISADTITTLSGTSDGVDVQSLDGNTHGDYRLDFELTLAQNGTVTFRPNGVATNKKAVGSIYTVGAGSSANWTLKTNAGDHSFTAGDVITGHAYFRAKTGRNRYIFLRAFLDAATDNIIELEGIWTDTSTNVTSFDILHSVANGFAAGSYLRVTRLNTTN